MDHFVAKGGRPLRMGRTTGSCAALAARAAVRMLLTGAKETSSSIITPKGIRLDAPLSHVRLADEEAACAVQKDAGDDPDITNGVFVHVLARRAPGSGITIDGGEGVGRVTKPGLDQPVGAAAINSVPRKMIESEVRTVCGELGYAGGVSIIVGVPGGEGIAAKTFNPNLGIVGGLSIIGTSGMVEPMSTRAIADTMRVEMNVLRAEGATEAILTPGNYGERFLRSMPVLAGRPYVKCSNFIGEALDTALALGFERVLLVGHIGKLIKLAGGVMDTHSRVADCRLELLALHAALAGADAALLRRLLDAATVDDGLDMAAELRDSIIERILARAEIYLDRRTRKALFTGLVVFSNAHGLLGVSANAKTLISRWEETSV